MSPYNNSNNSRCLTLINAVNSNIKADGDVVYESGKRNGAKTALNFKRSLEKYIYLPKRLRKVVPDNDKC